MKLSTSSHNNSLNYLGSLSKAQENNSKLIYIYPMIFDAKLEKLHGSLLRDFQTVQFLNQIKTVNALNIIQNSLQSVNNITPEYKVVKFINPITNLKTNNEIVVNNSPSKYEYERILDNLKEYIKNQIVNDPTYDNLRPTFSLITYEDNLIENPLVIGTKPYKLDSQALFWILFLLISTNRKLNDDTSLVFIQQNLKSIHRETFLDILNTSNINPVITSFNKPTQDEYSFYSNFMDDLSPKLKKSLETFKKLNSLIEFETDIGFSTNCSSVNSVLANVTTGSMAEQLEVKAKCIAYTNQKVSTYILPILQIFLNVTTNKNISDHNKFHTIISKLSDINSKFINDIFVMFGDRLNDNTMDDFVKGIQSNCSALENINMDKHFEELFALKNHYNYSNLRVFAANFSNSEIINFFEKVSDVSNLFNSQAISLSKIFENVLMYSIYDNLFKYETFERVKDLIFNDFYGDIFETDLRIAGPNLLDYMYAIDSVPPTTTPGTVISGTTKVLYSVDPTTLNKNKNMNKLFENLRDDTSSQIAHIICFLFVYSSFVYFCEFLSKIESQIKLKIKNAVEFPNYTIVLPYDYLKMLYYALASKRFNNNVAVDLEPFKLYEIDAFKIINAMVSKLEAKNIIIVDESKNEIYYKWVYMSNAKKITESGIRNYIKSQSTISNAF